MSQINQCVYAFHRMDAKLLWNAYRRTEEWNVCCILPNVGKKYHVRQNKIYYILPNVLFMRFLFDYKVLPLQMLQLLFCRFFTVIFVEHICGTPNP